MHGRQVASLLAQKGSGAMPHRKQEARGLGGVEPLSPAKKNIAATASRGHTESASRRSVVDLHVPCFVPDRELYLTRVWVAAGARDRAHQNVLEEARQSLFVVSALRLHAAGPRELRVQVQRCTQQRCRCAADTPGGGGPGLSRWISGESSELLACCCCGALLFDVPENGSARLHMHAAGKRLQNTCSLLVVDERTSGGMGAQGPLKRGSRRAFRE